jgi:tetratricopeptide (TPR) repeat protein
MSMKLFIEEQAGNIQVALKRKDALKPEFYGEMSDFKFPITSAELEDLRWYLENYLPAPYAVWEEKGIKVQQQLEAWGTRLFEALFDGRNQPFRDAYVQAIAHDEVQFWISSNASGFLGLPWELLFDPEQHTFLALHSGGIHRTIPARTAFKAIQPSQQLRVLMVIARPLGVKDVPYQMIARKILQHLELLSGKVVLEVLRPPTFENLKQKIAHAAADQTPYDVLHFDGHGSFGQTHGRAAAISSHHYQSPEGYLVFETQTGKSDPISAEDFAAEMKKAQIPLFVLNACKSGQLSAETGPEAAVVTRLIQTGAAAAVAMSYSVYAVAAAEFMAMFYEAIFAGRDVADAVCEGRRQMHQKNHRPSPKGELPLDDWLIPVHYARSEIAFPQLKASRKASPQSLADTLQQFKQNRTADASAATQKDTLRAEGRFFGRDADLYRLERAFGQQGVVILHGVGGTGKTELAKAFARWLQRSGGLSDPSLVRMDVFEPGLTSFGLSQMVTTFGLRLLGPDFVKNFSDETLQQQVVLEVLAQHHIFWIWDNFETICSMPDPDATDCQLDRAALDKIKTFLAKANQQAAVGILITSRSNESWLGTEILRLEIKGLNPQDAALYADDLLVARPYAQQRREKRSFGDLITFLNGHPLSMRLILPHLEQTDAKRLLEGLTGGELPPGFDGGKGRLESLGASVLYSFRHLPPADQQRLPVLSLFEAVVDVDVLMLLSQQKTAPHSLQKLTREEWQGTFTRAQGIGLFTELGAGIYRMHPALPGYLTALWQETAGTRFESEREQTLSAAIHAFASLGRWIDDQIKTGSAETAMAILQLEKSAMLRMVQAALERGWYDPALDVLQPIDDFWDAAGLHAEAKSWAERIQDLLETTDGKAPDLSSKAGGLWLFIVGSQANRFYLFGDLEKAATVHEKIKDVLESSNSESAKHHLATSYHELGRVAQARGDLEGAETWYQKSLEITEALENRPGMASTYHQLGSVAQDRGDLEGAETWYQKSLEIEEALENRPGMALTYGQMGLLSEERQNKREALDWTVKCVGLFAEFPHPATGPGPNHLVRLTQELDITALEESWQRIWQIPLPPAVKRFV